MIFILILRQNHHLHVEHILVLHFQKGTNRIEIVLMRDKLGSLVLELLDSVFHSANVFHQFAFFSVLVKGFG
jgi:hypothetical protein